ncbi:MAG: hypothetical protein JWL82_410 [Parcubacteria group bacterium]|nr:hypothetical protein [Parcubacteria group bacterium]
MHFQILSESEFFAPRQELFRERARLSHRSSKLLRLELTYLRARIQLYERKHLVLYDVTDTGEYFLIKEDIRYFFIRLRLC